MSSSSYLQRFTAFIITLPVMFNIAGAEPIVTDGSDYCLTDFNANAMVNEVQLNWVYSGAPQYNVYRSNDDGVSYQLIVQIASSDTHYLDSGLISGASYRYAVKEVNSNGVEVCQSPVVHVTPKERSDNKPPVFISSPVLTAEVGVVYHYNVEAIDRQGDPVRYSLKSFPAGMSIDSESGLITWTPAQTGEYKVTVRAVDDAGLYDQQTYMLNVSEASTINQAPQIVSTPVTSGTENQAYQYDVDATDPDAGDVITYALVTAPTGMVIDSATGLITWVPGQIDIGGHAVTVIAADPAGLTDSQSFTLQVLDHNRPPSASDIAVTTEEDVVLSIALQGQDIDGDSITYSIVTQPLNGQLSGVAPDLLYTPNADFNGSDSFTYLTHDGLLDSPTATVDVTVSSVNDAPVINSVPVTSGIENQAYQYQVQVEDPDSNTFSYNLTTAPAAMSIDANGLIEWTPDYLAAGDHPVTVAVQDTLGASGEQSFTLTIADTNRAPVLSPITDVTIEANTTATIDLSATDADGDALTFQVDGLPAFATHQDISIDIAPGGSDLGTYSPVAVTVSDGIDSQSVSFAITVVQGNRIPVITSIPTPFVIEGDEWRYTLEADDPDGDSLTYAMIQAPSGAALEPATGLITWPTAGVALGNYDFLLSVADGHGGVAEQAASIEVLPAERALSHVGTEFWIPVSHNMTTNAGGTFDINLVSEGTDTETTIEIAALGVLETLPLTAGQMATYSINLDEFAATEGFTLNALLENHAIHITAATPVSAYFMSQKVDTTDGFVGLPVASLGQEYITATYIMLGKIGIMATVDAGQPGPITTLVATEDNTQVTIDPIMDIFTGGQGQIEAGTPIELTMNRGDVYNLETRGSFKADLTGSTIRADKPIGVFGQMDCVVIPVGYTACDHIVEQLPPVESLATEYYTAPFWGRTENGRFWHVEYGDTFRAVAPYDNTAVYIDEVLRARLDRGEYFEFRSFNPQRVKASHPILLVQYANSNSFDEGYRELEADFTDPFMVVVPPAEQFLTQYTINTPARNLAYNFVNLLAPTAALSTLTLDGQSVDPGLFHAIPNSPYSYSQLPITPGSHHIEAQEPFGAYVYGYDSFESYGYLGGMAFSVGHTVASLSLTGDAAQTLDSPWCGEATVLNAEGVPVNGARIRFNLAGATNRDAYRFADVHGIARYCYSGDKPGIDTVTASVNQLSQPVTVEWSIGTQSLPPVVMSLPDLEVVAGESFTYDLLAEDPEGEALVYTLVEGPAGMTIDGSGHLAWPQAQFSLTRHNREKVVLRVTDPLGLEAVQRFELNEYEPFNTPPTFGEADISLTATQGVPYVYNQEHIHHSLQYLMNQVVVSDADKDAAFVDILSGPDEAYVQRVNAWYTGDTRENDPRSMVSVIHYLRWIPQEVGGHAFELGLRDARGGTAQSRSFTVNVLPNLPPQIVDFNPPSIASMGYQYSYILNVENDVPPHANANLDDLKVVFEQAPAGMRYDLVMANGTQKLQIYWTPNGNQLGLHSVRLHIEDQLNSSATEEFTINVVDDNQPPVVTSGSMPNAEVSIPYEYRITATDPDGDALTYRLAIAAEGMTVDPNTGVVSWIPPAQYSGQFLWVRFTITDAQGLTTDTRNHLIRVDPFTNRAPEFVPAYRPNYAKVGREYTHQPQAIDREGDYPITYRLGSYSPEPIIDSENGTISWTPTTEGSFWITVAATDSLGNFASNRQITWYVEVVPATTPLDVDLQLTPAEPIDLGESVTLNVIPRNMSTTPQVSLTVDGAPADLDALLASTITPDRVGRIPVTVTVGDGYETVERTTYVVVRDPNDTTPPVVELTSPSTASTITSLTDIIGTAQDDNLVEVRLAYKRADQSDAEYIDLYQGSRSFDNEIIASLDPSLLVNGTYHILLQATDSNNNVMGRRASVFVDGDLKVGQFSFTVEDLELSLAGIPITVSRTYDSRRRTEALDFGHGWTVDYQNVRLEESQEPTQGWQQVISQNETFQSGTGLVNTNAICIYPVSEKSVSVTLANKEVEKFRVVARPSNGLEGALSDPDCYMSTDRTYDLFFEPIDGTQSTLETSDAQSLYLSDLDNGYLATAGDGQAQPVTHYTLTTRSGYVYQLNQGFGVERITDPNGQTLIYSDSGISHSDGKQVTFTRDAQGRISAITDPMGHRFDYAYSSNGDLVGFTDPTTATTRYTYNNQHGLIDIIDPLDRSVLRNHYDGDGRLYAQEDGAGNWKYFDHNLTDNSTVVTDLDGRVSIYNYDDEGNVLNETQVIADNSYSGDIITRYTYDANGNQASKAIGESTWTTHYDERDDLQTAIDPEGGTIRYEHYTPHGQAGLITDERGNSYEMSYDTAGNLNSILAPQVTDPDTGEITQAGASNVINASGQIESTTDMRGHTTTYAYYPAGHEWAGWKQSESSPVTGAITYTYDANGNVKSETRERTVDGVVTTETTLHDYDERNRLTKTTYPDGSYIETVYDLAGNVDLERDRFGNWTDYDYDPYGRLTLTTYPDTTSEQREYTREGLLERIIDRSGHTTRHEYDDAGRLWRTHYEEAGSYTETRYTEQGWVSQAWDENRNLTEYEYDRAGRRTAVIRYLDDGTAQRHEFSYYRNGELHTETDANQRTTTYVLNELDQRIRTEYPNNTSSEQRFDAMGARIGMIDQNAIAASYGYDPQGRLERVTPEVTIDGTPVPDTGYSYDEQGNKLSQTDANGRTTTWAYDSFGRVIRRTLPEGMRETFVYDDSARTQSHTDFNGDITLTRYDVMGRISTIDYQKDGTRIDYTYWPNDQVRTVTDPQGTTEYSYDNRDRLASRINPDGSRIDYAYDNAGNRTQVSVSDASGATLSQTGYGYDALDRLTSVTDAGGTTQYTYDDVGNLDTVTYPNGMVTDYDYNSVSQLTHVATRDASGTLVGSYSYTLDDTGRRESITEASGRVTHYAYDDLYRLTGETITDSVNGDYSAGYQYDWVGNRTDSTIDGVQTAYTYDRNDRLTRQGGTSYTYDNNGNTLTETLDSTTTTYGYNARNELVSVSQGGTTTEYGYNPNGIRSSKRENGVTTRYIVDENRDYAQVLI
ncbi:MAG: putative Ig domain-containing protein, partial [Candidatus Thiodiazotropha endolucinida]